MKSVKRPRALVVALAAITAFGGFSASAILAANDVAVIRAGNLVIRAEGQISPSKLPRHELAPIRVHLRGSVATTDGSHVPPAKTVNVEIDKHVRIDTEGLPGCTLAEIEASPPTTALRSCGKALLGKGWATAEVALPEQAPFSAKGQLLAFNGPSGPGYSEQLDYVYADVPVPTALIVIAKFSKASGPYSYRVSVTVPTIAGGSGSFTGFDFELGRQWTYRGRRHSYLSAECPTGRFVNQVEASFGDGIDLKGTVLDSCQEAG